MRPLLAASLATLASLTLLSAPASAGTYQAIHQAPELVELSGVVTVPLQADPAGNDLHLFWADVGSAEEPAPILATVRSGSRASAISPGLAEKLGLKKHKKKVGDTTYEVVELPRIAVDGAVLSGVQAFVPERWNGAHDLELSMPATGLAWALLPSQGKLVLAPADHGAAVLAMVSGAVVPFTSTDDGKVKYGKDKHLVDGSPYEVQASLGAATARVRLGHTMDTNASKDLALEGPTRQRGDLRSTWVPVTLGGVEAGSAWVQSTSDYRIFSGGTDEPVAMGLVGMALLHGMDMAVDPSGNLALARAAEVVAEDPTARLVELAQAELDECLNPEEPLPEEAAAQPAGKRCGGQYGALADALAMAGDLDKALEQRVAVAEAAPQVCDGWLGAGSLQLQTGRVQDAVASLSKASAQYHAWWTMDAWQRAEAQKDFDKLSQEEQDAAELRPQGPGCVAADAMLAVAHLANGDVEAVKALYDQHMDLDGDLASVYGSTLILADEVEQAHGPWRMVDHVNLGPSLAAKAGLGRLFAQQGDWANASVNYQRALDIDPDDLTVALMWAQDLYAATGAQDALRDARKWAAERPDSLAARVAVARLARLGGKDTGFISQDADALFAERLALSGGAAEVHAAWAMFLLETGRADQARAAATAAVQAGPDVAVTWMVMGAVHEGAGEAGPAREAYKKAIAIGGAHPGYALLLPKAQPGAAMPR